jgi:dienelactone hydrolase
MSKWILGILVIIVFSTGYTTLNKHQADNIDTLWKLPKNDIAHLPKANYASLTQIYTDHMLQNRDMTFRDERLLTSVETRTLDVKIPTYKTKEEWDIRKKFLKERVLVSAGLWPMPVKTALNPKYYHKIEHEDYIIETVTIETYPGYFLAGNLYSPKKGNGPFPAILTPHGHFNYGRLNNDDINSIPGRCINLARQGYVVFAYDMPGYNDTRQVSHTFADDNISSLYSINLLGLQLWNSIRAMDYLTGLSKVDTRRVGITGASGGATQIFMLTAVDDRFQVSAPVNMVSNHMQGGDLCENAPGLRTNTINAEIAAMTAPRPLLLISNTNDWTDNTRNTIVPVFKSYYRMYNAEDKLKNEHFDYKHNFNRASREAMYAWFGKWLLGENDATKLWEKPFVVDSDKDLLAFMNEKNSDTKVNFGELPSSAYHNIPKLDDKGLKEELKNMYARQLNQNWPTDKKSLLAFRSTYGTAIQHQMSVNLPDDIDCKIMSRSKGDGFIATQLLISKKDKNEWIPCVMYQPLSVAASTVIVTSDEGKASFVKKDANAPNEVILKLLSQKSNVLVADLFKQGEHVLQSGTLTRRKESDRFFTTYNLTDRQQHVQDILTIIKAIRVNKDLSQNISLYATGDTGLSGLLLAPLTTDLNKIALDGDKFDPTTDENMLKLQVPGILRIGGLKTVLALAANKNLLIYNANTSLISSGVKEIAQLENNKNLVVTSDNMTAGKVTDYLKN